MASSRSVPAAFLRYPNYRGLIFDDRPEISVDAPSGATVTVVDKVSGATVGAASSRRSSAPVTISATTLTQGHPYVVNVIRGGSTLMSWNVTPVPASSRATMNVSFGPTGHLLFHGTPRFLLGVYDSGLSYSDDPAFYESTLFAPGGPRQLSGSPLNFYLNFMYGQAPLSSMQALMTTLQDHGMMYVQTGNCFDTGRATPSWTSASIRSSPRR